MVIAKIHLGCLIAQECLPVLILHRAQNLFQRSKRSPTQLLSVALSKLTNLRMSACLAPFNGCQLASALLRRQVENGRATHLAESTKPRSQEC